MAPRGYTVPLIVMAGWLTASAQVSPGPLSRAHTSLEGITQCTTCHERGAQVANARCLACHTDIQASIRRGSGLHARNAGSTCETCHKEHLGLDVRITQFDRSTFNHPVTGFTLTGAHKALECERCHRASNVTLAPVKSFARPSGRATFLGLDTKCASCHADRHDRTLGADCAGCHSSDAWKPAPGFKHASTEFPLTGKHADVACGQCHAAVAGTPARLFTSKPFANCTPCHTSPHPKGFGGKRTCVQCHSTAGWKQVEGFDHSVTAFPLIGAHTKVACAKCHTSIGREDEEMSVRFATKPKEDCTPCHASPHGAGFAGRTCTSCHRPQSWSSIDRDRFDHRMTRFSLAGAHGSVACERCHARTASSTFASAFRTGPRPCVECHRDPHGGIFVQRYGADCARCHTEEAFVPSTVTLEMHGRSAFPLTGAHRAVACSPCHRPAGSKEVVLHLAAFRCESCHEDRHRGQFAQQMRSKSCAQCHATSGWSMRSFDHAGTGFPLSGKHAAVGCAQCHKPDGSGIVVYAGTPRACIACHADIHRGQFAVNGTVTCQSCHRADGWTVLTFDHETQSSFSLTGAHRRVACAGCHRPEKDGNTTFVRFKPLPKSCESCHQGKS